VRAEADRFEAQQNNTVSAGLGLKQNVDFKLNIASASESILVQEQAPLINPENPNTSPQHFNFIVFPRAPIGTYELLIDVVARLWTQYS
jgi:hypothetical protein